MFKAPTQSLGVLDFALIKNTQKILKSFTHPLLASPVVPFPKDKKRHKQSESCVKEIKAASVFHQCVALPLGKPGEPGKSCIPLVVCFR